MFWERRNRRVMCEPGRERSLEVIWLRAVSGPLTLRDKGLADVEGSGAQRALDTGTALDDQPPQRRRQLARQEPVRGGQRVVADIPRRVQADDDRLRNLAGPSLPHPRDGVEVFR